MKAFLTLALVLCAASIAQRGWAADAIEFVLPGTVAVVEGVEINDTAAQKALDAFMKQKGEKFFGLTVSEKWNIAREVVEQLVRKQLIKNRCAGVEVTDAEVDKRYEEILHQAGGLKKLEEQLEAAKMTEADLKDQIRERFREQKWFDGKLFSQGEASDADAKAYYDANPAEFNAPEKVRASHIIISVPSGAQPNVQAQKLKIIEAVADRISKGEDFAKVAAEVSEDPRNKEKGGDLGYFTKSATPAAIVDAAFALKDGEVSKVVVSRFGFHLVKRTGHKDAHTASFEEAQKNIIAYLTRKNRVELSKRLVDDIRSKTDVKINLPVAEAETKN